MKPYTKYYIKDRWSSFWLDVVPTGVVIICIVSLGIACGWVFWESYLKFIWSGE